MKTINLTCDSKYMMAAYDGRLYFKILVPWNEHYFTPLDIYTPIKIKVSRYSEAADIVDDIKAEVIAIESINQHQYIVAREI